MAPKFGTSGLRGLVVELTEELVSNYTRAFVSACPTGGAVHVGQDLRPSSAAIAEYVMNALRASGVDAIDCGAVSTPALALDAISAGHAAIMVTGSHIPADRNGLKFYIPSGEISKDHETDILRHLDASPPEQQTGAYRRDPDCMSHYIARYINAFGRQTLAGMRIGVYQHSSVVRDALADVVANLGATPVILARSEHFIPVDTEAVDPRTRDMVQGWCRDHALDAVVSSDGDADRPMLVDETGRIIPGDVLGVLTAQAIGADHIVTPVSSSSMVRDIPEFTHVTQTKIGSPYVIAQMQDILDKDPRAKVAGYEANGGFLLGFVGTAPDGPIAPLMTRDCLLPMIAPLWAARSNGQTLSQLVNTLPHRFTATDRITDIPTEKSLPFIQTLTVDADQRADFFSGSGQETDLDLTDGLRVTFADGSIVHLRPSGNAPECRCYVEADTPANAQMLMDTYLTRLAHKLG